MLVVYLNCCIVLIHSFVQVVCVWVGVHGNMQIRGVLGLSVFLFKHWWSQVFSFYLCSGQHLLQREISGSLKAKCYVCLSVCHLSVYWKLLIECCCCKNGDNESVETEPKQYSWGPLNNNDRKDALYNWGQLQSQVIILWGFDIKSNILHIAQSHLTHCWCKKIKTEGGDIVCPNSFKMINLKMQRFQSTKMQSISVFCSFIFIAQYCSDTAHFICFFCLLVLKLCLLPGYDCHVLHYFCALWGSKNININIKKSSFPNPSTNICRI